MGSKLRNCCITINNYNDEHVSALKKLNYKFLIIGDEVGESGTPHLQVYLEMKNPISFTSLTKKLLKQAHIENRKGTPAQARDYCAKENIMFEDGELSNQGKRSDIDRCVELINDGNTMKDIAKAEPNAFIRMNKGLKAYRNALISPRDYKPEVIVLYGPTGTGKSFTARQRLNELNDDPYYIWSPARGKWWDHYDGEEKVIIEEFRGQLSLGYMLSLLDRYECPVEYKGGTCEFRGRYIYITSPKHPRLWYDMDVLDRKDKIDQLIRRISKIEEMTDKMEQK